MCLDVVVECLVVEVDERVDSDNVHFGVGGQHRAKRALASFGSSQATDQAIELVGNGSQRFDFSQPAAFLLAFGSDVQHAQFGRLLFHRLCGLQGADVQAVFLSDRIASCEGFGEVDTGVDEQDGDIQFELPDHVADGCSGPLQSRDGSNASGKRIGRPFEKFLWRVRLERLVAFGKVGLSEAWHGCRRIVLRGGVFGC
jgi:hypothetical protein